MSHRQSLWPARGSNPSLILKGWARLYNKRIWALSLSLRVVLAKRWTSTTSSSCTDHTHLAIPACAAGSCDPFLATASPRWPLQLKCLPSVGPSHGKMARALRCAESSAGAWLVSSSRFARLARLARLLARLALFASRSLLKLGSSADSDRARFRFPCRDNTLNSQTFFDSMGSLSLGLSNLYHFARLASGGLHHLTSQHSQIPSCLRFDERCASCEASARPIRPPK